MDNVEPMEIGDIGNYYGGLAVKEEDAKCFWAIENWNGYHWEEIPKYLYDCIVRYENERRQSLRQIRDEWNKRKGK